MGLRWVPRARAGGLEKAEPASAPVREPRPALWWIVPAALGIGGAIGLTAWWLLAALPALPGAALATARVEIVRTALAAGTGLGAAIALMLAFRRQRHQEIAAAHATHDATERRVTELYTKAVEQLGNAKAPVRLGGLYALERLAQDNPGHRQTIVDVICAYLRMPYDPPRDPSAHEKIRSAQRAARTRGTGRHAAPGTDSHEERQVRLTAERILTTHLRPPDPAPSSRRWQRRRPPHPSRFWPGTRLDLTGATLLDADFTGCQITDVIFTHATFTHAARFERATFSGKASFDAATFLSEASFGTATFSGQAGFKEATFSSRADFDLVTFSGKANFDAAAFSDMVSFDAATFSHTARFAGATFSGEAWFLRTTFFNEAWFLRTTFSDMANFGAAVFSCGAHFDSATFSGQAGFKEATFSDKAAFDFATFSDEARFENAIFHSSLDVSETHGVQRVELTGAEVRGSGTRVWPAGWHVEPADGSEVLRRTNPGPRQEETKTPEEQTEAGP
ncbi:pentapeptide repeat-containing protein [Bailinhaonella thermotolerans]|nr:pentapeptide repeat-containing protein [Bailinhaonella thermotolerans]